MKRPAESDLSHSPEGKKPATEATTHINTSIPGNPERKISTPPPPTHPLLHPMLPLSVPAFFTMGQNVPPSHPLGQSLSTQRGPFYPTLQVPFGVQGQPLQSILQIPKTNGLSRFSYSSTLEKKTTLTPQDESRKQLEELKKTQRKSIFQLKDDNDDIIFCLPDGHQLEYFPKLHLGRHAAHANEFTVDEFWVKIRYPLGFAPGFNILKLKQSLVLTLKNSDRSKTLLTYDSDKMTISEDVHAKPISHHSPRVHCHFTIAVQSHTIGLDDQKICKAINGRSDGMKTNVQEFRKKERVLEVFFQDGKTSYTFAVSVICCSSSSFQIALRPYREEEDKILEFRLFLDCLTKYKTTMKPLVLVPNSVVSDVPVPAILPSRDVIGPVSATAFIAPEVLSLSQYFEKEKDKLHAVMPPDVAPYYEERISLQDFMEFYVSEVKPQTEAEPQTEDLQKAWKAIHQYLNDVQPRLSTLHQISVVAHAFHDDMSLLQALSSPYFGGFVMNPFSVARAIECSYECRAAKWETPGGYMTTVMARHVLPSLHPHTHTRQPHSCDDYYLFLIESPQWDESKITYIQPHTGAWESVPRCSIRPYKLTSGGCLTLMMSEADRSMPGFDRFDFNALSLACRTWSIVDMDQHFKKRQYRPYTVPSHHTNDYTIEERMRVTPPSLIHVKV